VIEEAFKGEPDAYFTVADLARLAYSCWSHPSKSERVAILRAAKNVARASSLGEVLYLQAGK